MPKLLTKFQLWRARNYDAVSRSVLVLIILVLNVGTCIITLQLARAMYGDYVKSIEVAYSQTIADLKTRNVNDLNYALQNYRDRMADKEARVQEKDDALAQKDKIIAYLTSEQRKTTDQVKEAASTSKQAVEKADIIIKRIDKRIPPAPATPAKTGEVPDWLNTP